MARRDWSRCAPAARPRRSPMGPSSFSFPRPTMWPVSRSGSCASDGGCSPSRARMMRSSSAAGASRRPARRRAASASTGARCRSRARSDMRNGPGTSHRISCCGISPARLRASRNGATCTSPSAMSARSVRCRTSTTRCFRCRCPTRRAACASMATARKPPSISRATRRRSSSTRSHAASPARRSRSSVRCSTGAAAADARRGFSNEAGSTCTASISTRTMCAGAPRT